MQAKSQEDLFKMNSVGFGTSYDRNFRKNHAFQQVSLLTNPNQDKPAELKQSSDYEFIRALEQLFISSVCSLFITDSYLIILQNTPESQHHRQASRSSDTA